MTVARALNEGLVEWWREVVLARQHERVAAGEIPAAQAAILADMAAARLAQMLHNAEETKERIAYDILKNG